MNSLLYDKEYEIPQNIIDVISNKLNSYKGDSHDKGVERAKGIINKKKCTYQQLKRIKNYFDNINDYGFDKNEFELNGGNLMRGFVDKILNSQRSISKIRKKSNISEVKSTVSNVIRDILVENDSFIKKNAIGILSNSDNKVFLAKRVSNDHWEPSKWALVGGGLDGNETYEQCLYREIKEEIGIEITNIQYVFDRYVTSTNYEKVFNCTPMDTEYLRLNFEHDNFGWFTLKEIAILTERNQTVPLLLEYVKIGLSYK